jgi:hypothetical protein
VNTLASRRALTALAGAVAAAFALAALTAPAVARRDTPDPMVTPTPQPFYDLASPPPTVMQASAADACANDAFLSYRTVPMPFQNEVTVCGIVYAGPAPTTARVPHASFLLDVDGTDPIAIEGSVAARPGDVVVVRGRYHRENGGFEGIDETHTAHGRGQAFDGYVMVNGTISH